METDTVCTVEEEPLSVSEIQLNTFVIVVTSSPALNVSVHILL